MSSDGPPQLRRRDVAIPQVRGVRRQVWKLIQAGRGAAAGRPLGRIGKAGESAGQFGRIGPRSPAGPIRRPENGRGSLWIQARAALRGRIGSIRGENRESPLFQGPEARRAAAGDGLAVGGVVAKITQSGRIHRFCGRFRESFLDAGPPLCHIGRRACGNAPRTNQPGRTPSKGRTLKIQKGAPIGQTQGNKET